MKLIRRRDWTDKLQVAFLVIESDEAYNVLQ